MGIGRIARAAAFASLFFAPALAEGAAITLPSGREVMFHDVVWGEAGPGGLTVRFRFLEPGLAETVETMPYDQLEADMAFLCESYALGRITTTGPQPATIMISISDRPVAFGEPDPEATQVFEAYSRDEGRCIWEGF